MQYGLHTYNNQIKSKKIGYKLFVFLCNALQNKILG